MIQHAGDDADTWMLIPRQRSSCTPSAHYGGCLAIPKFVRILCPDRDLGRIVRCAIWPSCFLFRTFSAEHLVTHRGPDETECAFNGAALYPFQRQASRRCLANRSCKCPLPPGLATGIQPTCGFNCEVSRPRLDFGRDSLRPGRTTVAPEPVFRGGGHCFAGLGIGASTAMFTLADALLYRPLPVPAPERLVRVDSVDPS